MYVYSYRPLVYCSYLTFNSKFPPAVSQMLILATLFPLNAAEEHGNPILVVSVLIITIQMACFGTFIVA